MKKACTFTPATTHFGFLRDSSKHSCLNKPGRAGFSPHGGTGVASQPPIGHYFFSPFTATLHHVHTQTFRAGNPGPCRKANHPRPQPGTRPANGSRPDRAAPRISGQSQAHCLEVETGAANARQAVKQADYLPIFSTQFFNLQCVRAL